MATVNEIAEAILRADAAGDLETVRALGVQLEEAKRRKYEGAFRLPRDTGILEDISTGFRAGAVGLGELAALGGAALLEEEDELAAREKIKAVADYLRPTGGDPESITYKLASGIGSIAGTLAPAVGAAFLPVSAGVATGIGLLGAGALGIGAGAGEASERARAAGVSEDVRSSSALKGAFVGATEIIPLGRILRIPGVSEALDSLVSKIGKDAVEEGIGRVRSAAATGAVEGIQEGAAAILQNLIEQGYNPERALVDAGVLEEGAIGAGSGAIVQAVADLFIKGKTRSSEAPEPEARQGELFPDADLGTAPPPVGPQQAELFPDADLGVAPERPDERQLDLFGAPGSPEEVLRQRIRDARLEEQRKVQEPIAPYEEVEDPFFERTSVDKFEAGQELAALERQEQLELTPQLERSVQEQELAAERERAGLEAAARDDVAAFEQPDLFPREAETARVVGEETAALRRMGERGAPEEVVAEPTFPEQERDLLSVIEEETQLSQLQEQEAAREAAAQRQVAESELETIDARAETTRQQETTRKRSEVLNSVLDGLDTASRVNVERRFSKALQDAGIANTKPTNEEKATIERATDLVAARPEGLEVIEPQRQYQVRDGQRLPQTELPFVPEAVDKALSQDETLTDADIDNLAASLNQTLEASDADTQASISRRDRTSVPSTPQPVGRAGRDATIPQRAERTEAPIGERLDIPESSLRGITGRARPIGPTVVSSQFFDDAGVRNLPSGVEVVAAPTPKTRTAPAKKTVARKTSAKKTVARKAPVRKAPTQATVEAAETNQSDIDVKIQEIKAKLAKKNQTLPESIERGYREGKYTFAEASETKAESVLSSSDENKISKLLEDGPKARDVEGGAAVAYLRPKEGTNTSLDSLEDLAFDLANEVPAFRTPPRLTGKDLANAKLYVGTGGKAADKALNWVRKNLSEKANKWFDNQLEQQQRQFAATALQDVSKNIDDIKTLSRKLEALNNVETIENIDTDQALKDYMIATAALNKLYPLRTDAVLAISMSLPPRVKRLLLQGELTLALQDIATNNSNPAVRNAANKLSKVVGEDFSKTKVAVLNKVVDDAGVPRAGVFDPNSNMIKLDATEGMNAHVLLHEMAHAATSATLANKNHPMTKQLTKLFEDVKPMLDSAYGSTNVDEFVSEAMSNPEFQQKLAGMNPGGTEITAWQRFLNSVGNFLRRLFGRPTKSITSALTEADLFIDAIITPAPWYRNADVLPMNSTSRGVKEVLSDIGKAAKDFKQNTPQMREKVADSGLQFLNKNTLESLKTLYVKILASQSLGDVAKKVGFGNLGLRMDQLFNEQRGALGKSDDFIKGKVAEANKWHNNSSPDVVQAMKNLIYSRDYGATIFQVDPTLTESEAKKRYDDEKFAIWKKQRADWNKIGKSGQNVYVMMRDTYRTMYEKLRKVIVGRIDDLSLPPEARDRLVKNVYEKLFDKQTLDVYFPLLREGQYKLSYALKDSAVAREQDAYVVEIFENYRERDRAAAALENDPNVVKNSVKTTDGDLGVEDYANAPPMSFVGQTLQTLKAANVDSTVQEQIVNLFLSSLPESSFAKSLQKRKGIAGHLDDPFFALETKGYDIGRQIVRMEYSAKLDTIKKQIEERAEAIKEEGAPLPKTAAGKAVGAVPTKIILNELKERIRFAQSGSKYKQFEAYAKNANQIAFVYTIGFNVASSLVNLSQVPLFVLPMLGGRYGEAAAFRELMAASKLVTGARKASRSDSRIGKAIDRASLAYGIDAYYEVNSDGDFIVRKDLGLDKDTTAELQQLAPLVSLASARGQLNRSFLLDALGLEEGGRARRGNILTRNMERITAISAMMFNQAERFNRQTTMIAAYKLSLNDITGGKPGSATTAQKQEAAERALYHTQEFNGGNVLETAPGLAQEGIGRVALMYKSYGIQMYYTMMKTAKEMTEAHIEGDKATRNRAFKQLLGVIGSSAFFAGLYGVPFYGAVQLIADALFLEDDEDDFNTLVRKEIGELAFKGPLQAMLGINIADRVSLSHLLIQENRYNPNASLEENVMYYLGGPALSVGKRFIRGVEDLGNGQMERGIESLLPPAVANAYKTTFGRYQRDGGIYTRRNDPIYSDMGTFEMMAQSVGFMPSEYVFRQEQNQRDKRIERSVVKERSNLMRRYYIAKRTGDMEELISVIEDMNDFGLRHIDARINSEDLDKSIKRHEKSSAEMYNGVSINPLLRRAIELSRMEYKQ